jgi:hypothetical protein
MTTNPMAKLQVPLDAPRLDVAKIGTEVAVMVELIEIPSAIEFEGTLLEPTKDLGAARSFRRSPTTVRVLGVDAAQVVMGSANDIELGALLRVHGRILGRRIVDAELIAVLNGHVNVE